MYQVKKRVISPDITRAQPVFKWLSAGVKVPVGYARVERVTRRVGMKPSQATVTFAASAPDATAAGVVFAKAYSPGSIPAGSRALIEAGGYPLLIGEVQEREDMGSSKALTVTFEDDRALLARLPVRGCVTWDTNSKAIKYVARAPYFNPGGGYNCVEVDIGGAPFPVPLFLPLSYVKGSLDATPASSGRDAWTPVPWTPIRVLRHLYYVFTQVWKSEGYDGLEFMDTDKIEWKDSTLTLADADVNKRLPEKRISQEGDLGPRSLAGVIDYACEACGSIGWKMQPVEDAAGKPKNALRFYSKLCSAAGGENNPAPPAPVIYLQRAGVPSDPSTAFDFHFSADYRNVITRLTLDGAPFEVEACFKMEGGTDDTIEKAWTAAEEQAFKDIITGDGTYAVVDGEVMDGNGGRLYAEALSEQSISLARQKYPNVLRAFKLKTGTALTNILRGVNNAFSAYLTHTLTRSRPFMPEQVQAVADDAGTLTDVMYEPRVLLSESESGGAFHQVLAEPGWKVGDDGVFYLRGLTDDLLGPNATDLLYVGTLTDPANIALKKLRVNASVQLDARASAERGLWKPDKAAKADVNGILQEVDPSWLKRNGAPSFYGVDPDGYRVQHQIASSPTQASSLKLPGDLTADNLPMTRVYRDETAGLEAAADRAWKDKSRPRRAASFRFMDLRPEHEAGNWVHGLKLVGEGAEAGYIIIKSTMQEVVYDFAGKSTHVRLEGF